MAVVVGNVLGNLKGKLGNLAARTVEGKTILSARPSSFNVNYDPSMVEVRQKFAVTANFSKYVYALPTLAAIWQNSKEKGISAYNTIFKANYPFSNIDKPSTDNIISPIGFPLSIRNASVNADSISAQLATFNSMWLFSPEEVALSISAVICHYDPIDPEDQPYQLTKQSKEESSFDFSAPYILNIAFNITDVILKSKYNNSILFLCVATKNAAGKVIQHSTTFSHDSLSLT